ncbi:MAG TPA: family 16 glycoside hydrolase [Candidatus Udaeobacter sp.]|nr:family 16 glycoside hydrolase [Candidatus Udaeobacter sp.]
MKLPDSAHASPRWTRAAILVLASATLGAGPDPIRTMSPPPPPAHTHRDGTLFEDQFRDGKLDGWNPDKGGVWEVHRGVLRADLPDGKQNRSFLYAGREDWRDYAVDLDVCGIRGVDKGLAVRVLGEQGVGVDLRGPGYQDVVLYRGDHQLGKARALNANGVWQHVRVEARGARYRIWVNGTLLIDRLDSRSDRRAGRIALAAYTGGIGECTVYYDNVVVTALKP